MQNLHWMKYLNQRQIDGKCFMFKEEFKNIDIVCLYNSRISTNDKILRTHSELAQDILEKSVEVPSEIQVDIYIEPHQLEIISSYMNNGLLQNEDITIELLKSAISLKLTFLVRKCIDYLMINICADNVFEILCCAYWAKEKRLASATWEFLLKNTEKIISKDSSIFKGFLCDYIQMAWKQLLYASNDYAAVRELQMLFIRKADNNRIPELLCFFEKHKYENELSALELAQVPRVPVTRAIFRQ